jgi:hypothetical protein
MHTLMMTATGLVLLAVFHFGTAMLNRRRAGPPINGHTIFIRIWFAVSAVNLLVGVFSAGYSVPDELLVHAIIFGVPALAALLLLRRERATAR